MSVRGNIRLQVSGKNLIVELPCGARLTEGAPLDGDGLDAYGVATDGDRWRPLQGRLLAALALSQLEQGHGWVTIEQLVASWWPGRCATIVGKQFAHAFVSRRPYQLGRHRVDRGVDDRIVEVERVTTGPYRINPAYSVEADRSALRYWMLLGRALVSPSPLGLVGGEDLRARARALMHAVSHEPRNSSDYPRLLGDLIGVELQLGMGDVALVHAKELGARASGYARGKALHLQAIALRQCDAFEKAIECDEEALRITQAASDAPEVSVVDRDLIAIWISLGETLSRQVSRREGRYKLFVNRLRGDAGWARASRFLMAAYRRALEIGDEALVARAAASCARHRARQRFRSRDDERMIERAHGLRDQMGPYVGAQWDRAWASAEVARSRKPADVDRAIANFQDLQRIGYAHQARLAARVLDITTAEPRFERLVRAPLAEFEAREGCDGEMISAASYATARSRRRCKPAVRMVGASAASSSTESKRKVFPR